MIQVEGSLEEAWVDIEGGRFKIRPLRKAVRTNCLALCTSNETYGDGCQMVWDHAVVDWDNIEMNGEALPFNAENIQLLPDRVWAQVAQSVLGINATGAEDQKN